MTKTNHVYISGSWGTLTVDRITGNVIDYDDEGTLPDAGGETGYTEIARVDLDEWRREYPGEEPYALDCLDVGSWDRDGAYCGPELDWREEFRQLSGRTKTHISGEGFVMVLGGSADA